MEQSSLQKLEMKNFALVAVILLAGCATTNVRTGGSDSRIARLEKRKMAIDETQRRCIDEALARRRDAMVQEAGTPEASIQLQTQRSNDQRDRETSECRALADQENAEIAEQERDEYENQAREERNRGYFMAVITTSGLH